MKQGALFYDELTDRYDIRFDLADYYGGCTPGTVWKYSRAANGGLPGWSTARIGILSASGRTT